MLIVMAKMTEHLSTLRQTMAAPPSLPSTTNLTYHNVNARNSDPGPPSINPRPIWT